MTVATSTRFGRPSGGYDGNTAIANYQKYQNDSAAVPKVAINSEKMDGDLNYLLNALNLIDDDLASIVAGAVTANSVDDAKLRQSSGYSIIGRSASTTGNVADITAGTDGHVLRRSGGTLEFGLLGSTSLATNAVTTAKITDGNVTFAKIASAALATEAEAQAGTSSSKLMTPERSKDAFDQHFADKVWTGDQAGYDAIGTKSATTLYFITE